ncbi:hypothetical protein AGMMS4956_16430 [Bacteroidia bacterium]|nr:hypothetical protein AGMMS4956_16430 [Bacteroidia bacterium]
MKSLKYVMSAAVVCLVAAVSFVACDKDKDNGTKTPTIIGVQPVRVNIGDEITITGQNFDGVTAVKFGDVQVAKANFVSATSSIIKVAVPAETTFPCTLALVAGGVSYPYGTNLTDASVAAEYPSLAPQEGKVIIVAKFLEAPCNDVVLLGSYHQNGEDWITTPSELLKFEAVEGYDDWYKVEVELTESAAGTDGEIGAFLLGIKPVQLKGDGTFNWDYQTGDEDHINVLEGEDIVIIKPGYAGEANIYFSAAGVAVFEFDGWKNGNTPCVEKVKHDYTFTLTSTTVPEGAIVNIVGNFGDYGYPGWDATATELEMTKVNATTYTITLNQVGEGTEYKYVINKTWDNNEVNDTCGSVGNHLTGTESAINSTVPNWKAYGDCAVPGGTGTFTITITAGYVEGSDIIITGNFATDNWGNSTRVMTSKGDNTFEWTGDYPVSFEYKVIMRKASSDDVWASGDNVTFNGSNFDADFAFPE